MPSRGRPPKPLDPDAPPAAAALGRELRGRRLALGLTLEAVAARAGCSPQYVSGLELARTYPARPCTAALDAALDADGALLALLPAAVHERALAAQARADGRYDDDVDPTNRRGLLEAGAAAALGSAALGAAPTRAREVDPELPEHWTALLRLLGRHDELCGPRDVLSSVRREIGLIAEHRQTAHGKLRTQLMRVEARWADLAAWLSEDTGRSRDRDAWTERALGLAREADYSEMVAFALRRLSEWTKPLDARRSAALAEAALRVRGVSTQTRALCAREAAHGYALAGDSPACERRLADAYRLLEYNDSPAPPWAGEFRVTSAGMAAAEARCWLTLAPPKAVLMYEQALREWPRALARDGSVQQARLAVACAAAGDHDRARALGRRALTVARDTRSTVAQRELKRLGAALQAA